MRPYEDSSYHQDWSSFASGQNNVTQPIHLAHPNKIRIKQFVSINQSSFHKFRLFKWLYHCSKTEERRMYEPWDGCVWIHSNRVLTYHLLHWQRAIGQSNHLLLHSCPPPSSPEIHITNVKYQIFYHQGLQNKHLTNKYHDTIELLLLSKIPHCYPLASKQQFN